MRGQLFSCRNFREANKTNLYCRRLDHKYINRFIKSGTGNVEAKSLNLYHLIFYLFFLFFTDNDRITLTDWMNFSCIVGNYFFSLSPRSKWISWLLMFESFTCIHNNNRPFIDTFKHDFRCWFFQFSSDSIRLLIFAKHFRNYLHNYFAHFNNTVRGKSRKTMKMSNSKWK